MIEAPKDKLEKEALDRAKKEAREAAISSKQAEYRQAVEKWLDAERTARLTRKTADELAAPLGLTAEDKKRLLG